MPTDIAIGTANLPTTAAALKKPVYLITLADGTGKTAVITQFISLDRPELMQSFVSARGIVTDADEDEIVRNFADIINKTPKEATLEMMFPVHRIRSIRSLVFNAVKPTTVNR